MHHIIGANHAMFSCARFPRLAYFTIVCITITCMLAIPLTGFTFTNSLRVAPVTNVQVCRFESMASNHN